MGRARASGCDPKQAPLTESLARKHAKHHTLFVTFTNAASAKYAANWARQLYDAKKFARVPAPHQPT